MPDLPTQTEPVQDEVVGSFTTEVDEVGDQVVGSFETELDERGDQVVGSFDVAESAQPVGVLQQDIGFEQAQDNPVALWDRARNMMKNPEDEGARAVQALVDAEIFKIKPHQALRYRDVIDRGVEINPQAAGLRSDLSDRVNQSWETGKKQNQIGELGYQYIISGDPAALERMMSIEMPGKEETFISESRLEEATRSAAKLLPMVVDVGMESIGKGATVGLGFGAIAALLGPEAIPPAAAIGFKIGAVEGAFEGSLRKEAGLALSEILRIEDAEGNQIDPALARAVAFGIGSINAAIEVSQLNLLLKTIPGANRIFSDAVKQTVTSETVLSQLSALAGKYSFTVSAETGQEIAQESTNIIGEELAKNIANAVQGTEFEQTDVDEVMDRLMATMKESAEGFAFIALPGTALQAGLIRGPKGAEKAKKPADGEISPTVTTQEILADIEGQPTVSDESLDRLLNVPEEEFEAELERVISGIGVEGEAGPLAQQFRDQVGAVVDEQEATAVTTLLSARARAVGMTTDEYIEFHGLEVRQERLEDAEDGVDTLQQISTRGEASVSDTTFNENLLVYLDDVNSGQMNERMGEETVVDDLSSGNIIHTESEFGGWRILYKNKEGEIVAAVQGVTGPDGTIASNIYVRPDARRQGIGTNLLQEAEERFGGFEISSDQSITGNALARSITDETLEQQIPQGTKAAVTFTDTQTIIRAFEQADVSSLVHELGHVFRRDLGGDDLATVETWAGVEGGNWTTAAEEKFARAWERYLSTGKAPIAELQDVFDLFKDWLTEIYNGIIGSSIDVQITPELQVVFDQMLTEQSVVPASISNLSSLFQADEAVKTRVRRTTGQRDISPQVNITERQALRESMRVAARAARKAASEGNKEGTALERARLKEIVSRATARRQTSASVKGLRAKIKKELKTAKVKRVSGKPVGKFTAEVQQVLDTLIMVSKLTSEEAEARIASNLEKYTQELPPQEVVIENHMLEMVARLDTFTDPELLQGLLDDIRTLKDEGRLTKALRDFNRAGKIQLEVDQTIDELGGIPEGADIVGVERFEPKDATARLKRFLKSIGKSIVGWDDLMDMLSFKSKAAPGQSFISKANNLLGFKNKEKSGAKNSMESVNQSFMDAFGFTNARQALKKIYEDNTVEIVLKMVKMVNPDTGLDFTMDLTFTRAELRKRAMELMDASLWDSFVKMSYSQNTAEAVFEALTPQDKEFIASQMQFYRDYYAGVNDVYKSMYGVNLPNNPAYSPITREGISKPVNAGIADFAQEMSFRASAATAGSLKARVGSRLTLAPSSDINVLQRHITEMEHFKAWAERIRDLNAIWKNPQVRAAVQINYGKDILSVVDNFIDDIARGGPDINQRLRGWDWFRVQFVRANLAVQPDIMVKQLTSFVAYAEQMPVLTFGENVLRFWKNPIENGKFMRENSILLQNRGINLDRDIKAAMNSQAHSTFMKHQSFLNMLLLNIQIGDQGAIMYGGWAYYTHLVENKGMTHEQAIQAFEKFTENTQQSADVTEQSYWQRTGSLGKLTSMFLSTPNQYLRKELGALRNRAAGRISTRQMLKTIAIYHLILPMFFQFVSDRFSWDEDEQKRAMILGSLNGWFIVGDGLDYMLRKMLGMTPFNMELPVMSVFHDFLKATALVELLDLSTEEFLRAVTGLAGVIGASTGLPMKTVISQIRGGVDVLDGEYEKGLTELMGYSPYQAEKLSKD